MKNVQCKHMEVDDQFTFKPNGMVYTVIKKTKDYLIVKTARPGKKYPLGTRFKVKGSSIAYDWY